MSSFFTHDSLLKLNLRGSIEEMGEWLILKLLGLFLVSGCNGFAVGPDGILKMLQIIFGLIGWSLLASLPYNEEIFVKGETLTFHITLALLISVWLVTVIIYILGISHSDKKDSMLPLNGPGLGSYKYL